VRGGGRSSPFEGGGVGSHCRLREMVVGKGRWVGFC
jgi:hypothetical protein